MADLLDKIIEAKEIIGDDAFFTIANYLHIENIDTGKMKGSCPFGHSDSTPSFIWDKESKTAHCFSCGKNYSILDMYIETEGSYLNGIKKLFKEAHLDFDLDVSNPDKKDILRGYKYPKAETNTSRGRVEQYLQRRSISSRTLDIAGIKEDKYGNIVFEARDIENTLLSVKYRKSGKVNKDEPKMWYQRDASNCPILYNINKIDLTIPLLIVEGHVDCLSCIEAGYTNTVSIPNGANDLSWIEFNYEVLDKIDSLILWFDNDRAGKDGLNNTINRLGEYKCKIVKPNSDVESAVNQYYKNISQNLDISKTDANNVLLACGKGSVLNLIETAEEIPSKRLKYLMDYDPTPVSEMETISTGFKNLDQVIFGNIFPCFTIYSGQAGSGKSSLANLACLIAPVEQGYRTFVYSGELDNGQLSDWIYSPLAGRNHTIEFKNEGSRNGYAVSKQAIKEIKNFYRPYFVVYDDEDGLDTSGDILLQEMVLAYKKYGCKVFVVDNLMVLSFNGNSDESKWETQKGFIKKLMAFTTKYGVNVNLIVHPKKPANNGITTHSVYDLHGASEIGNLCHRLIWVDRLQDDDEGYDVKLTVVKDRPSQAAGKTCKLFYDIMTRRIYSNSQELMKSYKWEESANIIYPNSIQSRIVKNIMGDKKKFMNEECNQI